MEKKIVCPMSNCKSDKVYPKGSSKEVEGILVCIKCLCHFKEDGTILRDGDRMKFDRLEKALKKRRRKKSKKNKKKKPKTVYHGEAFCPCGNQLLAHQEAELGKCKTCLLKETRGS